MCQHFVVSHFTVPIGVRGVLGSLIVALSGDFSIGFMTVSDIDVTNHM